MLFLRYGTEFAGEKKKIMRYEKDNLYIISDFTYQNKTEGAFQNMKPLDRALNAAVCINKYVSCALSDLIINN